MSDQIDPTQLNYKINMSSEYLKNSYFLKKKKKQQQGALPFLLRGADAFCLQWLCLKSHRLSRCPFALILTPVFVPLSLSAKSGVGSFGSARH